MQFNTPHDRDSKQVHVDYDHTLVLSKNDTLGQLKERIARVIDIPSDSFRLSRSLLRYRTTTFKFHLMKMCDANYMTWYNSGRDAPQLKDDSKTLNELGFIDFSGVYVSHGRPLKAVLTYLC
jgi:hypothetical protein